MNGQRQSLTAPGGSGGGGAVTSVAGRTGAVTLTKVDVGLSNVDNTADASKPVSTAQAAANAAAQAAAEATAATALSAHAIVTSSVHGISTFAATFLDDANAAAVRTTIGSIGGTLGATDNALTRADGAGGATAQGSGVTLDDSSNLSAANWTVGSGTYSTRTYARLGSVAANLALILSPTGTGFISSQIPDGTNTGGNLRGDNSVDFSYSRTASTRVASGVGSFNGGLESTASGPNSFAWNGTATGSRAIAMAGPAANATGANSIAIGPTTTASAQNTLCIGGEGGSASGIYATSIGGFGNLSSGSFSYACGYYASASLYGQFAHSSGRFAAAGDCQTSLLEMRAATANATPTNLFLDGSSARLVVPANSSGVAMISISARTNTATDQHMMWRRRVNWKRGVAVGTVSVDVETVGTDRGYTGGAWGAGPAWTLAITADTTNGAINIIGTGVAATNIRWGASIEWIETTFA